MPPLQPELKSERPLAASDAVAAILVTPDQQFLLQHRDDIPHIWYPGALALFGGGIDPGETELEALYRELREEIGFAAREARMFTRVRFDFEFAGGERYWRTFFEVPITEADVATMRLAEGQGMRLVPGDEALRLAPMTGYDNFALYLYIHRARIRARSAR